MVAMVEEGAEHWARRGRADGRVEERPEELEERPVADPPAQLRPPPTCRVYGPSGPPVQWLSDTPSRSALAQPPYNHEPLHRPRRRAALAPRDRVGVTLDVAARLELLRPFPMVTSCSSATRGTA
jgi:hypothetical protein